MATKIVFLGGEVNKEIYIDQLIGFLLNRKERKIY